MPTVLNITRRPLRVRLPGGKTLFLGPGKSGKVAASAVEHPALVALIEAGEVELQIEDGGQAAGGGGGSIQSSQNSNSSGGIRHTGDR